MDRKNKDVASVSDVRSKNISDEEVGVVQVRGELILFEKTPRGPVKQLTLPGAAIVEFPVLDLDFPEDLLALDLPAKDQVHLINVEKPAVGIPAVLKKLELCVGLAKDLIVASLPAGF